MQKVKKPRDGRRFQNYRKGFYLCIDRTSSCSWVHGNFHVDKLKFSATKAAGPR
jgi:hypothetical protein